ncbi:restriction endonuclease subunit S [Nocardia beijingensis]|uniref:restriction endonuclease subunit S n=1 Tax=Nocardia beijingensis TaxID=95162 RepID=UPI0018949C98|nr:restriction endonuclease subunit S [Nocardia beijingensis]MBF6469946.1 restriction endonuclease subunit S [Nocardia beijingensis]
MTVAAEWEETTIGSLASVCRGASPRPIASSRWFDDSSNVRWVRIADVNRSDGRTLQTTTQALSPDGIARSRYLEAGTLIMSIAATVGIPVITGVPTCIHDGFVALENLQVDQRFLLYLLKASESRLRESGQSGSQMNVNTDIVKGLHVCIPVDRREQARIAAALWDIDDLIVALERLIAKKQAIKQGMMQQLLTGRTRLLGFAADWQQSTVAQEFGVQLGKRLDAAVNRGQLKTCINNRGVRWGKVQASEAIQAPLTAADIRELRLAAGDVLMCEGGEIGRCAVWCDDIPEAYFLNTLHRLRSKGRYNPHFLAAHFERWADTGEISAVVGKATLAHLTKENLLRVPLPMPTRAEQNAIADILTDADQEIELLRERQRKACDIKAAMMQQLLTGRTRLPVEASA